MGRSGHTVTLSVVMMGTEMIPEASVILKQLTRITALEDFIKFINTY